MKQNGIVEECQVRFEQLRSFLSLSHPYLDEEYFVSSSISGLEELIRLIVKMLFPTTVGQAVEQARLHELSMETFARRHWLSSKNNREKHNTRGGVITGVIIHNGREEDPSEGLFNLLHSPGI